MLLQRITLLFTVLATHFPAAQPTYANDFVLTPVFIAGGTGGSVGDFGVPESVAIDSLGRVAVTDKGRMMVHVYDLVSQTPLFDVGSLGSGPLKFDRPNGIAVNSSGQILVVEQRNRRVQILSPSYEHVGEFRSSFSKPMGIAIDSQDRYYVTDEGRGDVQVFDSSGGFLFKFGKTNPRLARVESIEVHEASSRIFVCDESKSRVNVYDMQGNFIHSFGQQGSGPGEFGNDPNAVRLDGEGRIYVNDQGNTRINVYAADTSFLAHFYNAVGGMESADGMTLSEEYNVLLVADQGHDRVLGFNLEEMQCALRSIESERSATGLHDFGVFNDAEFTEPATELWQGSTAYVRVFGSGDPNRIDLAWARFSSDTDPAGLCVALPETDVASGRFEAAIPLRLQTDSESWTLRVAQQDQFHGHLAGEPNAWSLPVQPLPNPVAASPQIDGESELDWSTNRSPTFTWTFSDPNQKRDQTARELRILRVDGSLFWQSGPQFVASTALDYAGPDLPTGELLRFGVRVASGAAWSDWAEISFRLNTPAPIPAKVSPLPGSILERSPENLGLWFEADPDRHTVETLVEIQTSGGRRHEVVLPASHTGHSLIPLPANWLGENETLRWRTLRHDGYETAASPWWVVWLDALAEPPRPAAPLAPADKTRAFQETIRFDWTPSLDPDPQQLVRHYLDWSRHPAFAEFESLEIGEITETEWRRPEPDGPLYWRIRSHDGDGHWVTSETHELQLERRWRAMFSLRSQSDVSSPIELGVDFGATDAIVPIEDARMPAPVGTLFLAIAAQGPSAQRQGAEYLSRDWRHPRSAEEMAESLGWRLILHGAPSSRVELRLDAFDLPEGLYLTLRNEAGRALHYFHATQSFYNLALSDLGQRQLSLHPGLSRSGRGPQGGSGQISATRLETPSRVSLSRFASNLPNPLGLGAALAPSVASIRARVTLYDVRGRRLREWHNDREIPLWDGRDANDQPLAPGVYFLRLRSAREDARRKVTWSR